MGAETVRRNSKRTQEVLRSILQRQFQECGIENVLSHPAREWTAPTITATRASGSGIAAIIIGRLDSYPTQPRAVMSAQSANGSATRSVTKEEWPHTLVRALDDMRVD